MYAGAELKLGDQVSVEFTPPYSSPPVRVDRVTGNRTGCYYGWEFLTATSSQQEQTASFERQLSTLTSSADRAPSGGSPAAQARRFSPGHGQPKTSPQPSA